MKFLITILTFLGLFSALSAEVIPAGSCTQEDVQVAINLASDGDTVKIPEGKAVWTSPLNEAAVYINSKSITLMGAGIDKTVIIDSTGTSWGDKALLVTGVFGKPFRISGIRFNNTGGGGIHIRGTSMDWRIDNCEFWSPNSGWTVININGYTYGVIHNCNFFNGRILPFDGGGHESWKRPLNLGGQGAVFVENCYFDQDVHYNVIDSNHGGRYVFRFNKVQNSYCEVHSLQNAIASEDYGFARSTRSYEIYHNKFEAVNNNPKHTNWVAVMIRGGTGVVFGNSVQNLDGPSYSQFGVVDNVRTFREIASPLILCDGTNPLDGNIESNGYPCLDQIGRSTDYGAGDHFHPQELDPLYVWNNTLDGQIKGLTVHNNCDDHIKEGRDYFNNKYRSNYKPYPFPHPLSVDNSPGTVLNLNSTLSGKSITLNWDAVDGADGYRVLRDWQELGPIQDGLSFTDTLTNELHVYMVYAYQTVDDKILAAEGLLINSLSLSTGAQPSRDQNLSLLQNYPNPFSNSTTISFEITQSGYYKLLLYDFSGRLVNTLLDGHKQAGSHLVEWNGTNATGKKMGNGLYFCKLESESGIQHIHKMILIGE